MALLLAFLTLTSSATVGLLLAAQATRHRLLTAATAVLAITTLSLLAVAAIYKDDSPDRIARQDISAQADIADAIDGETADEPNGIDGPDDADELDAETEADAEEEDEPQLPSPQIMEPGFYVEPVTADGALSRPTSITLGSDGELYIGHDSGIVVARDTTGDGFYDDVQHFGLEESWVFGLDFYDGQLYAAVGGRLLRLTDTDGDGVADVVEELVSGLPSDVYGGHSNSGIQVSPDGVLFMTSGGTSDHGPEEDPWGGMILALELDGTEGSVDPTIYATGMRNPFDVAFCPDGNLYANDNGPDRLGLPPADNPPDEINLILEGEDYGYPDYFGFVPEETGTLSPVAALSTGAGPTGLICYSGEAFGSEYHGDLFATLWGTFTQAEESGRRIVRIQLEETDEGVGVTGTVTDFVTEIGRPIAIEQDDDGTLLVVDHEHWRIFRIAYDAERAPTALAAPR